MRHVIACLATGGLFASVWSVAPVHASLQWSASARQSSPVRLRLEAEHYVTMRGLHREPTSDKAGGHDITGASDGDWAKYQAVHLPVGTRSVKARVASAPGRRGAIEIRRQSGALLARIPVSSTGSWRSWRTVTARFRCGHSRPRSLLVVFRTSSKANFVKVNHFTFTRPASGSASRPTSTDLPPEGAVLPETFGAAGDGSNDDGPALQRALNSMTSGSTLWLSQGRSYRHSQVLKIGRPSVTIAGAGTLLASNEADSAVVVAADGVTVDGPTIRLDSSTRRWVAYEQMGLLLKAFSDITVRNVTVVGSAAAGVYVGGARDFVLQDVTVRNTRADGIHMTEGASAGTVIRPTVIGSGDDGVAVVSYESQPQSVRNITIRGATVRNQKWGRAFSVVGGQDITFRDIASTASACAAIYVASEAEYATHGVARVVIDGATLADSNPQAAIDASARPSPDKPRVTQGAVLVYNSMSDNVISDVVLRDVVITDTDPEAYEHVQLRSANGAAIRRITLDDFAITGGYRRAFKTIDVAQSAYNTHSWTMNGQSLADHTGW